MNRPPSPRPSRTPPRPVRQARRARRGGDPGAAVAPAILLLGLACGGGAYFAWTFLGDDGAGEERTALADIAGSETGPDGTPSGEPTAEAGAGDAEARAVTTGSTPDGNQPELVGSAEPVQFPLDLAAGRIDLACKDSTRIVRTPSATISDLGACSPGNDLATMQRVSDGSMIFLVGSEVDRSFAAVRVDADGTTIGIDLGFGLEVAPIEHPDRFVVISRDFSEPGPNYRTCEYTVDWSRGVVVGTLGLQGSVC